MVQIIGSDPGPHELLKNIVFFIGTPGAGKSAYRIGTIFIHDVHKSGGGPG